MLKRDVRSAVDALVYLVDCQLATVEDVVAWAARHRASSLRTKATDGSQ